MDEKLIREAVERGPLQKTKRQAINAAWAECVERRQRFRILDGWENEVEPRLEPIISGCGAARESFVIFAACSLLDKKTAVSWILREFAAISEMARVPDDDNCDSNSPSTART